MQIFNDKLFINPIKIIKAFDRKGFDEAFDLIEYYKKNNLYKEYKNLGGNGVVSDIFEELDKIPIDDSIE